MRSIAHHISWIAIALAGCAASNPIAGADAAPAAEPSRPQTLISTAAELTNAIKSAQPGDELVLRDGEWADTEIVFEAYGTPDAPITLRAQTPGKVILSGQSSLRIGGEHLIVSSLVFKDGYSPRDAVISFRRDSKTLANNVRVTDTVIQNFSQPERAQRDIWVTMFGKNNVIERNHLSGKTNAGPTMAVRLNGEESQQNGHIIRNNYFGPRPVLGSNGGETLRIGTSHYSMTQSNTLVENNYFDRCSGEVEIISNKSGGNTYRGNTFFQSRGTLTLRHGNGTLVENNFFDGDDQPYTGGVRVINADQTVRNNYFKDLTGTGFSGGLVIMNGVPDSPINRYHQVNNAAIIGNTFDNVAVIELAEGADGERSAPPVKSRFENNILVGRSTALFDVHDDISGLTFSDNLISRSAPIDGVDGFKVSEETPLRSTGGFIKSNDNMGASMPFGVAKEDTGVSWFPKAPAGSPFGGGETITLNAGADVLSDALETARPGDTLVLESGTYTESRIITLSNAVSIVAADGADVRITFSRPNLFALKGSGGLKLQGLKISGALAPDGVGNAFITTSVRGGSGNHLLSLEDMSFEDFNVNRGFSVVAASKGSFFDRIDIKDSRFENISGTALKLDQETDDYGIYNAEFLTIENSQFRNIGGPVASVYRGGTDESTFGPHVFVSASTFENIGKGEVPLMRLHGVQKAKFTGNTVSQAQAIQFVKTTGHPQLEAADNTVGEGAPTDLVAIDDRRASK